MSKHTEDFITIDDAVNICLQNELIKPIDKLWLRATLEQKVFLSDTQYDIGYHKAFVDMQNKIKELADE